MALVVAPSAAAFLACCAWEANPRATSNFDQLGQQLPRSKAQVLRFWSRYLLAKSIHACGMLSMSVIGLFGNNPIMLVERISQASNQFGRPVPWLKLQDCTFDRSIGQPNWSDNVSMYGLVWEQPKPSHTYFTYDVYKLVRTL